MMKTARIFQNGRSQAVRLPKDFRFEGDEIFVHKVGNAVVLLRNHISMFYARCWMSRIRPISPKLISIMLWILNQCITSFHASSMGKYSAVLISRSGAMLFRIAA